VVDDFDNVAVADSNEHEADSLVGARDSASIKVPRASQRISCCAAVSYKVILACEQCATTEKLSLFGFGVARCVEMWVLASRSSR
jgi:hypothetical protein